MIDVEEVLSDFPIVTLEAGTPILEQGGRSHCLYFLLEGEVVVLRDGVEIAASTSKGSMYGEMSVILGEDHSATVKCVTESKFYQIDDPQKFMTSHPEAIWHITQVLCHRLANLNRYLIDMKHRYDEENYLRIVDDTLKELMQQ